VVDSPGLVFVTFRRRKELLCEAIVTWAALTDALGDRETEIAMVRSQ
jgi:hypothetical protein